MENCKQAIVYINIKSCRHGINSQFDCNTRNCCRDDFYFMQTVVDMVTDKSHCLIVWIVRSCSQILS